MSFLRGRIGSFRHAFRGLGELLRTQTNARIHLVATVVVIASGFGFGVSRGEWLWLVTACAVVWAAEAFNTALEHLADAVSREQNPHIGRAKDCAAAAVLLTSLGAAAVGVVIFAPYVRRVVGG